MAGPLRPLWVKRTASVNVVSPVVAAAVTEMPDRPT
jgi:hypothetical protein